MNYSGNRNKVFWQMAIYRC